MSWKQLRNWRKNPWVPVVLCATFFGLSCFALYSGYQARADSIKFYLHTGGSCLKA